MADKITIVENDIVIAKQTPQFVITQDGRPGLNQDFKSVNFNFVIRTGPNATQTEASGLWLLEIEDNTNTVVHSKQLDDHFIKEDDVTVSVSLLIDVGEGQLGLADSDGPDRRNYSIAWGVSPLNYATGSIRLRRNGHMKNNTGRLNLVGTDLASPSAINMLRIDQQPERGGALDVKVDFATALIV